AATDVKEKMLQVAGNMLEAAPADLDAAQGRIFVRGTPDRGLSLDEVAHEVYRNPHGPNMEGIEPALEAQRHFKIDNVNHQQETPTPFTPLGTKGVGESGVGAPLGALCSAIENALPELDLRLTELPLTPSRVWAAIQHAREGVVVG